MKRAMQSRLSDLLAFDRSMVRPLSAVRKTGSSRSSGQAPSSPAIGGDKPVLDQLLNLPGPARQLAVIGIDEVGRGCLAGPVVAAAVTLPVIEPGSELTHQLNMLNDSKVLAAREREELSEVLLRVASCSIAEASVQEIDQINILQASLLAMRRARLNLQVVSPVVVLVDGNKKIPKLADRQITVVKGDSLSAAIAAASVIAKVYRDRLMSRLSEQFPDYLWHQNKGYGSPAHRAAIKRLGLTAWHRKSFSLST